MITVTISPERQTALGKLLLSLEEKVASRAKEAFESAHIPGMNLDQQREVALDPLFSSEAKRYYGDILAKRNALAALLKLRSRTPHDLGWQKDYVVARHGPEIIFSGQAVTTTISVEQRAVLGRQLLDLEAAVNSKAGLAYRSAHIPGMGSEEQRRHVLDPHFSSRAKWDYVGILVQRNALAAVMGFEERVPHDFGWQSDYCASERGIMFT